MKRITLHLTSDDPGFPVESWNAFVEFLATSTPADLNPAQLPAYYVFWYESEVQNGGHLQYFYNRGPAEAVQAVAALGVLGAPAHAALLTAALASWHSQPRPALDTIDDYAAEALAAEFETHDQHFGRLSPLTAVLERSLLEHRDTFLVLGPGA